jgi:hypothetical protein
MGVPVSSVVKEVLPRPVLSAVAVILGHAVHRDRLGLLPTGLFMVMTTTRPEIIIEGSNDGQPG